MGVGTDYTKCFDLIPKAILVAMLDLMGMERGVLNAFHGMYSQLRRKFKIKGCLGAWWQATNGILQGCPLSVIVINALTTTWNRMIDDTKKPVVVATKKVPPQAQEPETLSCWWKSVGAGANRAWVWRCETPCCCAEMGWLVHERRLLPPNPDQGSTADPPPRPKGHRARGDTPSAQVWARLGLTEMASPSSTETSQASLRRLATPDS